MAPDSPLPLLLMGWVWTAAEGDDRSFCTPSSHLGALGVSTAQVCPRNLGHGRTQELKNQRLPAISERAVAVVLNMVVRATREGSKMNSSLSAHFLFSKYGMWPGIDIIVYSCF